MLSLMNQFVYNSDCLNIFRYFVYLKKVGVFVKKVFFLNSDCHLLEKTRAYENKVSKHGRKKRSLKKKK